MSKSCNFKADLTSLNCTKKAYHELQENHGHLKPRERQLLILLAADKHFCDENYNDGKLYCQACEKLLNKVDLDSLVQRGYLIPEGEEEGKRAIDLFNKKKTSETEVMPTAPNKRIVTNMVEKVIDTKDLEEPDEMLRFLAGTISNES